MTDRGRRKRPTTEDRDLWEAVSRGVKPLKHRPTPQKAPNEARQPAAGPMTRPPKANVIRPAPPEKRVRTPEPPRLAPLDRRMRMRVARGAVAIDARIDLHGLTQASAQQRLRHFLADAQSSGAKLVLVITGKGRQDETRPLGEERGVLRRSVPIWLSSAEFRPYIIGYEPAGRTHGGEGALYVRVRKRRASSF